MIVRFVDIGGIDNHRCLNRLFHNIASNNIKHASVTPQTSNHRHDNDRSRWNRHNIVVGFNLLLELKKKSLDTKIIVLDICVKDIGQC